MSYHFFFHYHHLSYIFRKTIISFIRTHWSYKRYPLFVPTKSIGITEFQAAHIPITMYHTVHLINYLDYLT